MRISLENLENIKKEFDDDGFKYSDVILENVVKYLEYNITEDIKTSDDIFEELIINFDRDTAYDISYNN